MSTLVQWREVVSDLLCSEAFRPSCQDGAVKRCMCVKCARARASAALATLPMTRAEAEILLGRFAHACKYQGLPEQRVSAEPILQALTAR